MDNFVGYVCFFYMMIARRRSGSSVQIRVLKAKRAEGRRCSGPAARSNQQDTHGRSPSHTRSQKSPEEALNTQMSRIKPLLNT